MSLRHVCDNCGRQGPMTEMPPPGSTAAQVWGGTMPKLPDGWFALAAHRPDTYSVNWTVCSPRCAAQTLRAWDGTLVPHTAIGR